MIHAKEKALLHIYSHAAELSDPAYREVLAHKAGQTSAADPDFTQAGFENCMAALETILFDRVDRGLVEDPTKTGHRHIRNRFYWRNKLPAAGRINSRQFKIINDLWRELGKHLPPGQWSSDAYFAGIVHKATGRTDLGMSALTFNQAGQVIEALKDRLSYAIRAPHEASHAA